MGILIANNGDKVVANMGARDAISKKFDGMEVTVLDAIADVAVGTGTAGYKWVEAQAKWVLIWKTSVDNLTFKTETKTIAQGKVIADYAPQDGIVWDCKVMDSSGLIVADITPAVTDRNIVIGSLSLDGMSLSYTYGYGTQDNNTPSPMYGEIRTCEGLLAPYGWLFCEGQTLAIADYPALFAVLGTTYGGDGITTFMLRDYRSSTRSRRIIRVDYHAPQPVLAVPVIAAIHGPVSGNYNTGSALSFSVQLLDDIAVTGGPVSLDLNIGGTAHSLPLANATARQWTFADYVVQAGDSGAVTVSLNQNGATFASSACAAVLSINSTITGVTVNLNQTELIAAQLNTEPTVVESLFSLIADKAPQATTYTKTETDDRIQAVVGAAPVALDTLVEIAAQLNADESAAAALTTLVATKAPQATTYTKTETDDRIQAVVGAAPAALDTLVEIAAQLNTDESAAAALTTLVATKAPQASTYTKTETDDRIQAVVGAAPAALDTLVEIAAQLNTDESAAATLTTLVASKAPQATTYTKAETEDRIQAIVGAAPAALDTLVEIAAQLNADESAAATLTTLVASKAPQATTYTKAETEDRIQAIVAAASYVPGPKYTLGAKGPGGGRVFYVDGSGEHGLEAKADDESSTMSWSAAMAAANVYGAGWHLPTKTEQTLLYDQKSVVGGFVDAFYWSSTEYIGSNAWAQSITSSYQGYYDKSSSYRARAVRIF